MGVEDFDFLIGNWIVHHRRLTERLSNCDDWVEFEGTCETRKILSGCGNMDEHFIDLPGDPYNAVAFRTFDMATQRWSIWWIDSRSPGELDPPLVGEFNHGVGRFYSDHLFDGTPIRVRFLWTNLGTEPHWEQAFTEDNGRTWEINWTMRFARAKT